MPSVATTQSRTVLEQIRRRLPHALEPGLAVCFPGFGPGHAIEKAQRIISGSTTPDADEEASLAKYLQIAKFPVA
jgi:hypothetical protein